MLWRGPSKFNGDPVVVILTGLQDESTNRKTGPMLQVYILRDDMSPWAAVRDGLDSAICGNCLLRAQTDQGGGRSCYVQLTTGGIESVWEAYKRGSYTELPDATLLPEGQSIRIGAYGDPAVVPTQVWLDLLRRAAMWTCYTHHALEPWCDQELRSISMASADSPEMQQKLAALGWRTFRTTMSSEGLGSGETWCLYEPYSAAKTKPQCVTCGLCDGLNHRGTKNIAVKAHGPGSSWCVAARSPLNKRKQLSLPII